MSKLNPKKKGTDHRLDKTSERLAGGMGQIAAAQSHEAELRRLVMACLLWEDIAYESGAATSAKIAALVPKVQPQVVAAIAIETRVEQKLRHVPLLLAVEMARHKTHRPYVEEVLSKVITRADQITDFMALYWKPKKCPIAACVKRGLNHAFNRFNEYAFAKYNRDGAIKLRDVMFMVHPKPATPIQEDLFNKIAEDKLQTPDTWEVQLSAGKDKRETFTRLINENKLGGLAFLRNLRNMKDAGVDYSTLQKGFKKLSSTVLLPLNFYSAYKVNRELAREIEEAMLSAYKEVPKLPGHTVFVVDVSGSMGSAVSGKSEYTRMEVAAALAVLAAESSERITVYVTAGSDARRVHKTERVGAYRGFALAKEIIDSLHTMGGGGIFTRQCIEHIRKDMKGEVPDRIIVFSDSCDCDTHNRTPAAPFGKNNYIVDVSSHSKGVNYKGTWTAEISGWSEHFLTYIRAFEGCGNSFEESVES